MRILPIAVLALIVVAFAFPAQARADTADDLLAKNLAAHGGADKLAAISSIQFTGKQIFPGGLELTYRETRGRKNGVALYEASIQGLTFVQGFDGNVGWRVNPFGGRRDAERMSEDDMRAFADDATIDGPLLSSKSRGSTVSYLGREDFEGTDTYKIRVLLPSGVQYMYFLDPDTYLEIKVVETRTLRGARQVTQTEYGDYELVNGVYFPFEIESGAVDSAAASHQKTLISAARANIAVPDAMFALPAAPSKK